jgi:hypothetical protein
MTRKPSQTTPPPSDAHATKEQKGKVVLRPEEDAVARETLTDLTPATRLIHETTVPKVKAIPTDNTAKAKVGTTHPHATLALANPNSNLVLTVVAPVTALATASNALLMRNQRQRQSNKQTRTSSLMKPLWNSVNQFFLPTYPILHSLPTLPVGGSKTPMGQQTVMRSLRTKKRIQTTHKATQRSKKRVPSTHSQTWNV